MTNAQPSATEDPHAALAALNARVDELVETAGSERWNTDTPAAGWDVAMQIAHLAWTDEVSVTAINYPDAFQTVVDKAMADPTGFVDVGAAEIAATGRDEVLARWRLARGELADALKAADPGDQIPWFGPPMRSKSMTTARIMETWAHGVDVADALGVPVDADPAFDGALPHIARLGFKTRGFAYLMNGLEAPASEVHVALTRTDGTVLEFGPADAQQRVTGPILDFCLLVTQRVHLDDTALEAVGEDALGWLRIAQAFAGLPGGGREKGARA
ncbi:TIGR03084 family metal-binding protein [Rhodococcus sp. IEGM 1408]|uniref:TIGR03084 family metal-binding protein n=1 Tax=Rhodococcus sp. IEGM 1408 TaxID=3082220 RepID=UPI002952BBB7|nr:TIGR03084 family metal-binding protein [Rhodococcus sp. IEGM 1408]MDV8001249.1 TIGR03084 family metal-binding protein [Rhodococcus sp. IEGM 1408]